MLPVKGLATFVHIKSLTQGLTEGGRYLGKNGYPSQSFFLFSRTSRLLSAWRVIPNSWAAIPWLPLA